DYVDVCLHKLAESSLLWAFAAPDLLYLVATEREREVPGIFYHVARERDGQIEVEPHAGVFACFGVNPFDDVDLFVDLTLSRERLHRFDRAGLHRSEAVEFESGAQVIE